MRHLKTIVLFIILCVLAFFGWRFSNSETKTAPVFSTHLSGAESSAVLNSQTDLKQQTVPILSESSQPETPASIPLISGSEETDVPWTSRTPAAKRVRRILPDPNMMTSDPVLKAGDSIQLALFPDAVFDAKISNVTRYPNGAVGMTAHLDGGAEGTVFLSYCDGQMRASIEVPGGADYYVRYNPETGEHYAIEVDREKTITLGCGDIMIPPANDAKADSPAPATTSEPPVAGDAPAGSTVVDVMIVYTPAALSYEGNEANMNANIAGAMQRANTAHTNSNTQVYLNLVHSEQVAYTESTANKGYEVDLDNLTGTSDGYMDNVHTLRDAYGADFTCLFVDRDDVGGVGWLLTNPAGDAADAFCLARVQQTDTGYTVVHEWGHNMGCSHSKTQVLQPWTGKLFSYSAGWQWNDTQANNTSPYTQVGYCSVMTYEDANNDGTYEYERVARFSNPSINYVGDSTNPTGHASDGDNARTMRDMKSILAAYRAPPVVIAMDESNIVLIATVGDTDAVSRAISNAGSGELIFSLSDDNVAGIYSWRDSDAVGGPIYDWIDISATGTLVPLIDDGNSDMINLGFNFPFYGNSYSQFQIAGNGVVSLSSGAVGTDNASLPRNTIPSRSFCLFWDDLNPSVAGAVCRYYSTPERLVVSYIGVPLYGTSDKQTFQLVLYPDGRIVYQYKTVAGAIDKCTVGIMDDRSAGPAVQVVDRAAYLKNSLAIEFLPPQPRWISYSVTNGTVTGGGFTSVEFGADASELAAGDYYATLTVTHNDTSRSAIEIPVEFHVTAVSDGDLDGDGLPDEWETQYFGGPTNANPIAMASNGVNTVQEAYIAGLDPTSLTNRFLLSILRSPSSVLRWNSVSGRVYSVYWTTNLLSGTFIPLQSNLTSGVFTDSLHGAEQV